MSRGACCLLALASVFHAPASRCEESPLQPRQWDFAVMLDGKPIGRHRFLLSSLDNEPGGWQLSSRAEYDVRILGITVYRYQHEARERWREGCLSALSSTTDDDGTVSVVDGRQDGTALRITMQRDRERQISTVAGCAFSYAYWHPALRRQSRLLNPQTGKLDTVSITTGRSTALTVAGQPVPATGWQLQGPEGPLEVWYDNRGEWIGLDALVSGKHALSYRLQP
ncbi:DUF6134 family protein [Uliginosibacterium sp. H1]|uniref:DUF6134 family protein n=1 Tax=Uliginosibacterium sp. H1 TaxID=3114757 RepID=UPI002E191854|nr:DUF6134 family protein [Uliginosibacterium sp. H1]